MRPETQQERSPAGGDSGVADGVEAPVDVAALHEQRAQLPLARVQPPCASFTTAPVGVTSKDWPPVCRGPGGAEAGRYLVAAGEDVVDAVPADALVQP